MSKLLIANLKRLKKNKLFWTIAVLFVVCTFFGLRSTYEYEQTLIEAHANMEDPAFTPTTATDLFFNMSSLVGLASSFMLAIFIGTEYHDNTMRNKLICGQSRIKVYLANFLTSLLITVIFWLLPVLVVLCIGIPLLGTAPMTTALFTKIMVSAAIGLLMCASFTALFTLIAMLVHNRSYALIGCISLALVLLFTGSMCESRLSEPETYPDYEAIFSEDGNTQSIIVKDDIPNPHYLTGFSRQVVTFLYDFLPGGQSIQLTRNQFDHPLLCLIYSIGITGLTSFAGIYFYRKKDLK